MPASKSQEQVSWGKGVVMRRALSKETLARAYLDTNALPSAVLHLAYLREPLECLPFNELECNEESCSLSPELGTVIPVGGAKYKEAREVDSLHFENLCSRLPATVPLTGDFTSDDLRVRCQVPAEEFYACQPSHEDD
eukprot:CAMPEP_0197866712 /NCGR_PEP_ID=MMETSP1438-20131217/44365_1 /TAXON_ID=1461541 /ORGANISM="Pterosperma sp., Strain CCMP1384" /LENGTH=137 /DNA_ID=CAMNT_0043485301 /DNA_START=654 /DNA_END=1064 /DNA_ORIENTATION=-